MAPRRDLEIVAALQKPKRRPPARRDPIEQRAVPEAGAPPVWPVPRFTARTLFRGILSLVAFVFSNFVAGHAAELPPFTPGKQTIQFTQSALQSAADEVKSRMHSIEEPGPFDITREKFQILVPKNYTHAEPWGLFIWINAGDAPSIPADWEPVLAARKLLFVGAFKSGNPRNIFDRVRLALDANIGMRRQFNIDGRRVYLSGFSGGARVASMVGVAYGDMFSGTVPFMGVNFYTELPAGDGKKFGVSYIPDDEVLELARQKCRYVLVTGEKDFNRGNTRSAYDNGFVKEKFANVLYLEVPALGHALPGAKTLGECLDFLDRKKVP